MPPDLQMKYRPIGARYPNAMILAKCCRQVVEKAFYYPRTVGVPEASGWAWWRHRRNFRPRFCASSVDPDEYKLYRAALEWDLTDPIVIETRKDLKSEKRWRNQLQPYHHQVTNLITFCRRLPVTLARGRRRPRQDDQRRAWSPAN